MNNVTGNEIIHQYLRHNKKFPHVLCAGCGHGIVLGTLIRSIHSLGIPKDDVVIVAGIGCSGRLAVYVDFNTVHTTHGRALTFATGIKMANPKLKVIAIMGDGDALSIGGNHLIHAARRNIGVTALVLNNNIYGMTGGQSSPATPLGATTMTNPYGASSTRASTPWSWPVARGQLRGARHGLPRQEAGKGHDRGHRPSRLQPGGGDHPVPYPVRPQEQVQDPGGHVQVDEEGGHGRGAVRGAGRGQAGGPSAHRRLCPAGPRRFRGALPTSSRTGCASRPPREASR